jgi:predicted Fe-Mo cluster-binding NifX family protein
MKIAVVTEDGVNVSQHFGRAPYYLVFNVEDGKITSREQRPKTGHQHFAGHGEPAGAHHGFDAASQARHASMINTIADCQVVIAGGMGWGAYESLKNRSLEVVVTDVPNIDEAVNLYIKGKLPNLMERLH